MARSQFEEAVAGVPFFADMDDQWLELLGRCASTWQMARGDFLMTAGEVADRFYVVRRGKVVVEIPNGKVDGVELAVCGLGDVLGWATLRPPHRWHCHALAIEPGEVIIFDADRIRKLCVHDALFERELLRRLNDLLVRRLREAHGRIAALYA